MTRSTRISIVVGALVGAALGLGVVALAAGRVLDAGVGSIASGSAPAAPAFVVGQAGMYLLVVVAAALGGVVLAMIGYGVGRESDPDAARFAILPFAFVGTAIGAALGFAVFRSMTGLLGEVTEGTVTLTVFRAIVVALVAGAVTGAVTAGATERLSRPETFGFTGQAWSRAPATFVRDAAAAVGLPLLGLVVGVSTVYLFSRALLNAGTDVALVLFGGVAALILIGGAFAAAMGSRKARD